MKFLILTPTYNRNRLLKTFIANCTNQSYRNFRLIIVHDGPSEAYEELSQSYRHFDERISFLRTKERSNNWGTTPRVHGLEYAAQTQESYNYLLFWDDDNLFAPNSLATIRECLISRNLPKLLVFPILKEDRVFPVPRLKVLPSPIDTACLACDFSSGRDVYLEVAKRIGQNDGDAYCQDNLFYDSFRSRFADSTFYDETVKPFCRYDGLRSMDRRTERKIDRILIKRIPFVRTLWRSFQARQ